MIVARPITAIVVPIVNRSSVLLVDGRKLLRAAVSPPKPCEVAAAEMLGVNPGRVRTVVHVTVEAGPTTKVPREYDTWKVLHVDLSTPVNDFDLREVQLSEWPGNSEEELRDRWLGGFALQDQLRPVTTLWMRSK